jgi:ATP-dependent DNA helicase HFM1/MER3
MCQASEFRDLRMKPNQRPCLREINKSPFVKFPIKETIATTKHKICLLIQMQLGGIEHPAEKEFVGMKRQFLTEKSIISERISRLIRCTVDCKAVDCDAISTRHALDLARSLSAGFWENSNLQLRQIAGIGPVIARKLVDNNINSIEKLSGLDTATIERYAGKNPPFGKKIQQLLLEFPRLTCTPEFVGNHVKRSGKKPKVSIKVRLGYSNLKTPVWDGKKPSLTFLAETSDGVLVYFWRGGMHQLDKVFEIKFTAELSSVDDNITCRVACDSVIGTQHMRVLKHNIPACDFPTILKSIVNQNKPARKLSSDEFGSDDINDEELLSAVSKVERVADEDGFHDMDNEVNGKSATVATKNLVAVAAPIAVQMANGKYACNHICRDGRPLKNGLPCKHRCCKEGLDKPRKLRARVSTGHLFSTVLH